MRKQRKIITLIFSGKRFYKSGLNRRKGIIKKYREPKKAYLIQGESIKFTFLSFIIGLLLSY